MNAPQAPSVGLGGDGDEVAAIENVEVTFGVKLDVRDAPNWRTAGDVYRSLCKALPAGEADRLDLWDHFVTELCSETGVDPKTIQPESTLLSPSPFWARMADANAVLWCLVVIAAAIVIAILLFQ